MMSVHESSVSHEGGPRPESTAVARYVVRIEGLPLGTFVTCDGLPEPGFGYGLAGTVRLTRPVGPDTPVLAGWLASLDVPRPGVVSITAYDGAGRPVAAWRLRDAWPLRHTGVLVGRSTETLEVAHCGVLRALA